LIAILYTAGGVNATFEPQKVAYSSLMIVGRLLQFWFFMPLKTPDGRFKKIEKKIKKKAEEAEKAILAAKLNHDMRQKYSPSQSESLRIRNNIYASIVLKEISKELASLSHEHSLRL
jgi:beta-lactam-binding protein with PASTA domain